jgi:glycosyltransferase involved in cell wall biosynthesis
VRRGHEVHVFTTNVDGDGVSDVPLNRPVDLDGVNVWYSPARWPRRIYRAPDLKDNVRSMLSANTIVHLHSVFLWPTWAAARSSRRIKTPYLISPRGMLVKDLIRKRSRMAKSAWIRIIERSNIEQASAIHMTSDLEAAELECFGWQLPRRFVVPNGIDDPLPCSGDVSEDILAATAEQPAVLFLGRISWKKGLDRLLRAFASTPSGSLAIAGTDDEGLAPQLVKLSEELGIADRVRILPRTIVGAEKEHLFAAARAFVLPSHSENFGNTVLEAMRRGVPVVTTPEVGAAAIVRNSGGGIVTAGDPESLGDAICSLERDPKRARAMGAAAKCYVMANYSWDQIAARMEDAYQSLT